MMDTTTVLDPPAAAIPAADAFRAPLPALVMGEGAALAPRRHDWPGRLFLRVGYAIAALCPVGVIVLGCFAAFGMETFAEVWKPMAAMAVGGVLEWRLCRAVSRFSRWGWIGAMAGLGGSALLKVGMVLTGAGDVSSALTVLAINGAWMRYFWRRRADFDIDLGG